MPWTEAAQALRARYLDETSHRALPVDAIEDLLPRHKAMRRQRPDPSDVRATVQDLINALLGGEYRRGLSGPPLNACSEIKCFGKLLHGS